MSTCAVFLIAGWVSLNYVGHLVNARLLWASCTEHPTEWTSDRYRGKTTKGKTSAGLRYCCLHPLRTFLFFSLPPSHPSSNEPLTFPARSMGWREQDTGGLVKDAHTAEVRAKKKKKKRKAWEGLISSREGKAPHAGSQGPRHRDKEIYRYGVG